MSKRHRLDPLQDHNEWIEHQYNPGYWINRFTSRHIASIRYNRRHAILNGCLGMIISGITAFALVYPTIDQAHITMKRFMKLLCDDIHLFSVLIFFALLFLMSFAFLIRGILDLIRGERP